MAAHGVDVFGDVDLAVFRPEVHVVPWPSAVMSSSPSPLRWTFRGDLDMVSTDPSPNVPVPVWYTR
jgi:hypothetical protein